MLDVPQIAEIHKSSYRDDHLTSALPIDDIKAYYSFYLEKGNTILVYEDNVIQAFALLVDYSSFNNDLNPINAWGPRFKILLKRPLPLAKVLLKRLRNPDDQKSKISHRVLSIATHQNYKSMGLASILLNASEEFFVAKGVEAVGATVKKTNEASNRLFRKAGFELEYEARDTNHYHRRLK